MAWTLTNLHLPAFSLLIWLLYSFVYSSFTTSASSSNIMEFQQLILSIICKIYLVTLKKLVHRYMKEAAWNWWRHNPTGWVPTNVELSYFKSQVQPPPPHPAVPIFNHSCCYLFSWPVQSYIPPLLLQERLGPVACGYLLTSFGDVVLSFTLPGLPDPPLRNPTSL